MSKDSVVNQVKAWITPSIIGILGMFLWRDLGELRADVKTLLAQSAQDQVKLQEMEKDVDMLKAKMWEYHGRQGNNDSKEPVSFFGGKIIATKEEEHHVKPVPYDKESS